MTSPIDPIRRIARTRRADRTPEDAARAPDDVEDVGAPDAPRAAPQAHAVRPADGAAGFTAQLLGQDSHKRGLRGGPVTLDAAKTAYNRTEWSGPADRRAPKGGMTNTDV